MAIRGNQLLLGSLAVLVVAVGALVIPSFVCRQPDPKLEDLGAVPPFALTDEQGHPFTAEGFRGNVTFVNFIFTRCDAICPTQTMLMEKVQEKTFDLGDKIKIVSFSIDPGYDTPARLADYAKRYRSDPNRWRFLTGDPATITKLVENTFFINTQREAKDTPGGAPNIAHQGYFLLVDQHLHIRGTYASADTQRLDEMMRDARYLVRTGK